MKPIFLILCGIILILWMKLLWSTGCRRWALNSSWPEPTPPLFSPSSLPLPLTRFVPPLVHSAPPLSTLIPLSLSLFPLPLSLPLFLFLYFPWCLLHSFCPFPRCARLLCPASSLRWDPAGSALFPLPLPTSLLPPFPSPVPMVVSRLGPRGLEAREPAWSAVWAAYTTVFIPLSSSLYSSKALHFFFWVSDSERERWER